MRRRSVSEIGVEPGTVVPSVRRRVTPTRSRGAGRAMLGLPAMYPTQQVRWRVERLAAASERLALIT